MQATAIGKDNSDQADVLKNLQEDYYYGYIPQILSIYLNGYDYNSPNAIGMVSVCNVAHLRLLVHLPISRVPHLLLAVSLYYHS